MGGAELDAPVVGAGVGAAWAQAWDSETNAMRMKTYQAETLEEAFRAIKADLGPDAIVINTQHLKGERTLRNPFGRPIVQVQAAISLPRPPEPPAPSQDGRVAAVPNGVVRARKFSVPSAVPPAETSVRRVNHQFSAFERNRSIAPESASESMDRPSFGVSASERPAPPRPPSQHHWIAQDELPQERPSGFAGELARSLEAQAPPPLQPAGPPAGEKRPNAARQWDDILSSVERAVPAIEAASAVPVRDAADAPVRSVPARLRAELMACGCDASTAGQVVAEAVATAAAGHTLAEPALRRAVYAAVATRVRQLSAPVDRRMRHQTMMVVGPSGVGKTTVLAKLMTQYAAQGVRKLVLIALERQPRPGTEPLAVLAGEVGAVVETARTPAEVAAAVRRHADADAIFIDTPGYSVMDRQAVAALRACASSGVLLDMHLVLAAHMPLDDFDDLMARASGLPLRRLLFTKLDEGTRPGRMLDMALRSALPVSYVTEGRDANGVIDVATPDRMAQAVCAALMPPDDAVESESASAAPAQREVVDESPVAAGSAARLLEASAARASAVARPGAKRVDEGRRVVKAETATQGERDAMWKRWVSVGMGEGGTGWNRR